jgi:hypothetical protein
MTEPKRLLATAADSTLTRALREARAQVGTPERMRALRSALDARLAAPSANAAAGSEVAGAGIAGAKAWLVLAAALAVLAGAYQRYSAAPRRAATAASPLQSHAPPIAPAVVSPPTEVVQLSPHAAVGTEAGDSASTAPVGVHHAPPKPTAAKRPSASAAASDPAAEVALISRAQQALAHDPQAALAALVEHQRRFASGVLAEEREALRFDALVALDRADDARACARAFVARFTNSPQRLRLQKWLDLQRDAALVRNPSEANIPTGRDPNREAVR